MEIMHSKKARTTYDGSSLGEHQMIVRAVETMVYATGQRVASQHARLRTIEGNSPESCSFQERKYLARFLPQIIPSPNTRRCERATSDSDETFFFWGGGGKSEKKLIRAGVASMIGGPTEYCDSRVAPGTRGSWGRFAPICILNWTTERGGGGVLVVLVVLVGGICGYTILRASGSLQAMAQPADGRIGYDGNSPGHPLDRGVGPQTLRHQRQRSHTKASNGANLNN